MLLAAQVVRKIQFCAFMAFTVLDQDGLPGAFPSSTPLR